MQTELSKYKETIEAIKKDNQFLREYLQKGNYRFRMLIGNISDIALWAIEIIFLKGSNRNLPPIIMLSANAFEGDKE